MLTAWWSKWIVRAVRNATQVRAHGVDSCRHEWAYWLRARFGGGRSRNWDEVWQCTRFFPLPPAICFAFPIAFPTSFALEMSTLEFHYDFAFTSIFWATRGIRSYVSFLPEFAMCTLWTIIQEKRTALVWAAGAGRTECVRLLLDKGAVIESKEDPWVHFSIFTLSSSAIAT